MPQYSLMRAGMECASVERVRSDLCKDLLRASTTARLKALRLQRYQSLSALWDLLEIRCILGSPHTFLRVVLDRVTLFPSTGHKIDLMHKSFLAPSITCLSAVPKDSVWTHAGGLLMFDEGGFLWFSLDQECLTSVKGASRCFTCSPFFSHILAYFLVLEQTMHAQKVLCTACLHRQRQKEWLLFPEVLLNQKMTTRKRFAVNKDNNKYKHALQDSNLRPSA